MDFNIIQNKKDLYEQRKFLLHEVTVESYDKTFEVEFTHNSTAIEGNTLSLIETKVILELINAREQEQKCEGDENGRK